MKEYHFQRKVKQIEKFLNKEPNVKITVTFKGRENAFKDVGEDLIEAIAEELSQVGKMQPIKDGKRQITTTIQAYSKKQKFSKKLGMENV